MATTSASAGARVWRRGRPARLGLTALVGGLVLLAGPTVPAASAGTSSVASACGSLSSGVTVVIDTGSSISTRCAGGDPASAMSALQTVASVVTPQRYPGSVVCRIDGYPASDPCIQMPPASAYWSFFTARRGGSWSYSSTGAAGYNPAAGTVIGFAFGAGARPRMAPPAAPVVPVKPKATTSARPKASGGSGGSTGGSASAARTPTRSASSSPRTSAPSAPGTSATTSPGAATPTASATVVAAAPVGASADGSGTARLAAAGGVLAALGIGALLVARRRSA